MSQSVAEEVFHADQFTVDRELVSLKNYQLGRAERQAAGMRLRGGLARESAEVNTLSN